MITVLHVKVIQALEGVRTGLQLVVDGDKFSNLIDTPLVVVL